MSFDLQITVRRGVTLDEVNAVLIGLEAPYAVGDLRLDAAGDGAQPDWSKPFEGGYQAFPLLPELSFQALGEAQVTFDGKEYGIMTGSRGLEPEVAMAVALALARCSGDAVILVDKSGEEITKLAKLEREVRGQLAQQWKAIKRQAAKVPEEIAAYRRPRPEDTTWTHYERVALREQPESAVAPYLRDRAARAIAEGRDAEIDRLLDAASPGLMPLEPLLDACCRAERADLGRRVLARFRADARQHFLRSVGYVGMWAVPYARFLASLGVIAFDADLLAQAQRSAADPEMRAFVEGLGPHP